MTAHIDSAAQASKPPAPSVTLNLPHVPCPLLLLKRRNVSLGLRSPFVTAAIAIFGSLCAGMALAAYFRNGLYFAATAGMSVLVWAQTQRSHTRTKWFGLPASQTDWFSASYVPVYEFVCKRLGLDLKPIVDDMLQAWPVIENQMGLHGQQDTARALQHTLAHLVQLAAAHEQNPSPALLELAQIRFTHLAELSTAVTSWTREVAQSHKSGAKPGAPKSYGTLAPPLPGETEPGAASDQGALFGCLRQTLNDLDAFADDCAHLVSKS